MTPHPLLEGTTKGPWHSDELGYVWDSNLARVANAEEHGPASVREYQANARLIAAAPELVRENEELLWLVREAQRGLAYGFDAKDDKEWFKRAEALLARKE